MTPREKTMQTHDNNEREEGTIEIVFVPPTFLCGMPQFPAPNFHARISAPKATRTHFGPLFWEYLINWQPKGYRR